MNATDKQNMTLKEKIVMCFATGFYVGNIPFAPGTFGTAAGLILCYLISGIHIFYAIIGLLLFIAFSVKIAHEAEQILDKKDPGPIVIDEIAGILVTLVGIEFTLTSAIAGFFIFRFFDILKPFPIGYIEKNLEGGKGVVFDDIAAGVIGNLVLRIILAL